MKLMAVLIFALLSFGCSTLSDRSCKAQLESCRYLSCWDSMYIGYFASHMPKEQWQELYQGFKKQLVETDMNIWCAENKK